jgi:hypothetical protein
VGVCGLSQDWTSLDLTDNAIRLSIMDIIQQCLSLAPVPYLAPAFSVLRFIWSLVEQAQASKRQLQALAQTIAQLLRTLNREYSAGRLRKRDLSTPLGDLHTFVSSTTVSYTLPPTDVYHTDYSKRSRHLFGRRPRDHS